MKVADPALVDAIVSVTFSSSVIDVFATAPDGCNFTAVKYTVSVFGGSSVAAVVISLSVVLV